VVGIKNDAFMRRLLEVGVLITLSLAGGTEVAAAAGLNPSGACDQETHPWGIIVACQESTAGSAEASGDGEGTVEIASSQAHYYQYAWTPMCSSNEPLGNNIPQEVCPAFSISCQRPDQFAWVMWSRIWRVREGEYRAGNWILSATTCRTTRPELVMSSPPTPTVTWQLVLREVQRVGLPAARLHTQPEGETLVNFDTIFYAEPPAFDRSLRLLGRNVEVSAEPAEYHWSFGDGEVLTTDNPGAPYPAKDVTHQYTDAHVTVHPSVEVVYRA